MNICHHVRNRLQKKVEGWDMKQLDDIAGFGRWGGNSYVGNITLPAVSGTHFETSGFGVVCLHGKCMHANVWLESNRNRRTMTGFHHRALYLESKVWNSCFWCSAMHIFFRRRLQAHWG